MDNFTLAPSFFPAPSCTCGFPGMYPLPAQSLRLQLSRFGHSVQMFSPPYYRYLNRQVTNQDRYMPLSPLNSFSIHPFFSCFQPLLPPVVKVEPLNEDRPQEVQAETVQHKANESPGSCQPVSLTPAKIQASILCRKKNALRQAKYRASDKGKRTRARYVASAKGRASILRSQIKYATSDKGKRMLALSRAKYAASDKGKKARAKYAASDKGKKARAKYAASDKGKKARARYAASERGEEAQNKYKSKYGETAAGKKRRALIQARYAASDKGKRTKASYLASIKGKVAQAKAHAKSSGSVKDRKQVELSVKSKACGLALTPGLSQELVIKKEKLGAENT